MNLSLPIFQTGLQRYALFFNFQIYFAKFSEISFFCVSLGKNSTSAGTPVSNGIAKVRFIFELPNFFKIKNAFPKRLDQHFTSKSLTFNGE